MTGIQELDLLACREEVSHNSTGMSSLRRMRDLLQIIRQNAAIHDPQAPDNPLTCMHTPCACFYCFLVIGWLPPCSQANGSMVTGYSTSHQPTHPPPPQEEVEEAKKLIRYPSYQAGEFAAGIIMLKTGRLSKKNLFRNTYRRPSEQNSSCGGYSCKHW